MGILLLCVFCMGSFAQEASLPDTGRITLSGPVSGRLSKEGSPYVVTDSITIPLGVQLTIEKGSVLLFRNFTGLSVAGRLVAEGTGSEPIIFTSENDSTVNPSFVFPAAPYDWDGILLLGSSGLSTLRHVEIRYSLFGINCSGSNVIIDSVGFNSNGKSDLVLAGVPVTAPPGPYSFVGSMVSPEAKADILSSITPEDSVDRSPRNAASGKHPRVVLRSLGAVLLLAGAGIVAFEAGPYLKNDRHFQEINSFDQKARSSYTGADWEDARSARNRSFAAVMAGAGCALLGTLGFTFSFAF